MDRILVLLIIQNQTVDIESSSHEIHLYVIGFVLAKILGIQGRQREENTLWFKSVIFLMCLMLTFCCRLRFESIESLSGDICTQT